MSRWETAKETVETTLRGKVSSVVIDVVSYGLFEAQIGFIKSWYGDTDHRELLSALESESFSIMTWTVSRHVSGGVRVTLLLRNMGERAKPTDLPELNIDKAREAIEELERTDPEGAELLKRKLHTGVVEG